MVSWLVHVVELRNIPFPFHHGLPGKMIGPDRFTHIATVCDEALLKLSQAEKINELVKQLEEKDDKIDDLLIRLGQEIAKLPNYSDLTVERAHRLCVARDKRIDLLTKKLGQKEHPGTESTGASKTDAEPQA